MPPCRTAILALAAAAYTGQQALADPERRVVANSILGTIRQRNRLDDSVKLLGEAIRLEKLLVRRPDHAGTNEVLGMLLMRVQRHADAVRRLPAAVQLNPTSVKANYQLGQLLARLGKKEEPIESSLTPRRSGRRMRRPRACSCA